ncbi:MAG: hypothetical protein M1835_007770 [Candelina submexicana]|nr:MAG: hypothetical protein M1835_007770 [Candelina submexicana]
MNKVKNRDAKLGTVERTMKKTGKIDRVTHERKAAHRNSQSCRLNGRDCGGADCEAEEYAVKMAYKHQKTIKALRGQLKQQSRAKTTILAKEHRRYHNQIKVLKAALDDAKNDLDAVENRAWTEPHELKTHASTTMAKVNFRSVLQRNELLEKKARIGDEYKKELRIASENLERARWTVKELKREADILNNKITSKDRKINALEEEAEAVRQVQRVIEDENISQKQELEAAEKRHQEASAKYKHDYENYQQMCIESFDIERKTNEQLRETVEALEPRMLGTKPRDQIIQTTVDDLQARLNKAEALNKDHHQEIENMVQRAAVSKAGYKGEILDLTRRLEEQHRLTADHPPTSHELSVNEDMLQDRINLLQDKVDASERWQVEASRLNDELTRKLNQAGADIQSMRDECERDYIKTSVAEEKFARREEEWRIERERLEEEKHNAIMQSYIPGLNGSKPGSGKDNPSSYETKQREWNVERTKLLEELDRTKSQFATLTCDKLEDDDKSQKIKSLEKVIKTLKAKTKASISSLVQRRMHEQQQQPPPPPPLR